MRYQFASWAIALLFVALTIVNVQYVSSRLHDLNSIPLRSNPLGGDPYQIGRQAVRDAENAFWIRESAIVVVCIAGWLLTAKRRPV